MYEAVLDDFNFSLIRVASCKIHELPVAVATAIGASSGCGLVPGQTRGRLHDD